MRESHCAAMSLEPAIDFVREGRGTAPPHIDLSGARNGVRWGSSPENGATAEAPRHMAARLRPISAVSGPDESSPGIGTVKGSEEFVTTAHTMIAIHGAQAIYVAQHAANFARDGGHPLEAAEWDRLVAAIREISVADSNGGAPTA